VWIVVERPAYFTLRTGTFSFGLIAWLGDGSCCPNKQGRGNAEFVKDVYFF
jgi:hypothetical protein